MTTPLLEVRSLTKSFHHEPVLDDVNLTVAEGETLVILGPSGSGKSTLLKCIAQLEPIDGGDMLLDGTLLGVRAVDGRRRRLSGGDITRQRRQVGMVFQNFALFGHLTVLQNVTLAPRKVLHQSAAETRERALELLARVGLAHKADAYPRELSGGQQQRIAIARSLAMRPRLLLFDEPTSALDVETIGEVLGLMEDLADDGMTMVVVTHETGFARAVAKHVMFMDHGKVLEHSTAAQFFAAPAHQRARDFLDRIIR
jgi:polar amino acid transport system ATP-binding protein